MQGTCIIDTGRLGELLLEAAKFGLGIFLLPPTYIGCRCPECAERLPAWRILVMGVCESEDLASGETIAEAVEFSFLPLQTYIEIERGLEPGWLPEIDVPSELELGRLAELAAEACELGVALSINSPSEYGPSEYAERWYLGVFASGHGWPIAFGGTLPEAVEHAFLHFRVSTGTGWSKRIRSRRPS